MEVKGNYIVKGDATCDGKITLDDLIAVQAHILEHAILNDDGFIGADTNNDNKIDGRDLANISMHTLGEKMLVEVVSK